VRNPVLVIRRN